MIAFTHGVASGDPTPHSAVLWTRVIDNDRPNEPVPVTCIVEEDNSGAVVTTVHTRSDPHRDGTVHETVDNLAAGRLYAYWFETGGRRSRRGWFRTLPTNETMLRFGVVSCAKFNSGFFNVYARLEERTDLDFVLHLGDYIYEAANSPPKSQTPGANIGRNFNPLHECRTLDDYRRRYAQYRKDPELQSFHARHAVFATIDDHEIADNAWMGGAEEHREEDHGPWKERVWNALRAWEEWMPTQRRPATRADPIYRQVSLGRLATIAVLDSRSHRIEGTQLGHAQLEWLASLTHTAESRWLIIGIPSTLAPLWSPLFDEAARQAMRKLKLASQDSDGCYYDRWDAFPHERKSIIDILAASQSSRILLSGDTHIAVAADINGDQGRVAVEWTTPSITSPNLDDKMGWQARSHSLDAEDAVRKALPHIRYCNFDDHGYLIVAVNYERARSEWWVVDSVHQRCVGERLVYSEDIQRADFGDS